MSVPWQPFAHGETALDFGSRYLFANPETRQMSFRWAHEPPSEATWCIKLTDLMATIPATSLRALQAQA